MAVEAFIADAVLLGLDEGPANDLRGCPIEVQKMVLQRGGLQIFIVHMLSLRVHSVVQLVAVYLVEGEALPPVFELSLYAKP